MATDFGVSLREVAPVAGWYFLLYGVTQPLWGLCSDRLGRIRTMRLTLGFAAFFGVLSVFAPTLSLLVVARACTGAAMAGVVPAGLVYVGDAVPFAQRQRTLTDLNAATAVGITLATAGGGVLAAAVSWRAAFLVTALTAGVLAAVLRVLPEPPRVGTPAGAFGVLVRSGWARLVLALALVEGAALLGLLTYLAPVLQSSGLSASAAGLAAGAYGLGLLATSRIVKRLLLRVPPARFLAAGSGVLVAAHLLVALSQAPWVVTLAALLIGVAWAGMHSTMQAWATEVVPGARALMVSLFTGVLFVGSGLATSLLSPLAGQLRWSALFAVGAGLAAAFGVVAPLARHRFGNSKS